MDDSESPRETSLQQLKLWLAQRSKGQLDQYRGSDADAFRKLGPRVGPIEELIKAIIPVTKAGAVLLVGDNNAEHEGRACRY